MTRTTLWLIAVFALISGACVAFGAYFSTVTLLNAYRGAIEGRFGVTAERLVATAELAASLGIALPAQVTLSDLLTREARTETFITSIDVADEHGVILFSSDPGRVGVASDLTPGRTVVRAMRNDLDRAIGHVVVRYDPHVVSRGADALAGDLWEIALPTLIGACIATIAIGTLLALGFHRAARRAADPEFWPLAARAALAAAQRAHTAVADRGPRS